MDPTNKRNQKNNEIPFIDVLKEAARIVWENKFLFWFGLLMALGSGGSNFNFGGANNLGDQEEKMVNFIETHWEIALGVILILIAIGVILFLISLIGKAGLIRSVNLVTQNKKTTFREGWRSGKKFLGRLFALFLLVLLASMIIIFILALPVLYLVFVGSTIGAILVGILAAAIFIPLIFIIVLTNTYAEFYIVLSSLSVWRAIEAGYNLLLRNMLSSIIFSLLLLGISIVAGLIVLPIIGMILLVLVPAGFLFYYLSKIVFAVYIVFAIIFFLAASLSLSSIFLTYKKTAWTLFFQEIAKIKDEEELKALEKKPGEGIAIAPEKA